MESSSHPVTPPQQVHLVVRLTLDIDTYQRLLIVRANTNLGERRDSFDLTVSYLLSRLLLGNAGPGPMPPTSPTLHRLP